ncbi:hypothetical protein V9K67_21390 [Paraflavisolibacter sp. H34]|uniref:hypothetical protein n=1 Tax=Huijunlia imazamoxiresistens TaxID=3127457 RepID=UPI003018D208
MDSSMPQAFNSDFLEAKLLTDKRRLQEIYDLRVLSYEDSPYSVYINKEKFPNGYFDHLDPLETTYHWIVEEDKKIIGSVRAAIIQNLEALKDDLPPLELPQNVPFAYCGRTAVHPGFRSGKVMLLLDHAIRRFITDNSEIKFAFCLAVPERVSAVKRLGFQSKGFVPYDWGIGEKTELEAFEFKK